MRPQTGSEIKQVLDAERAGTPFLVYRDGAEALCLRKLGSGEPVVTVGRCGSCDLTLPWDTGVSRTHAVLERLGEAWTIATTESHVTGPT